MNYAFGGTKIMNTAFKAFSIMEGSFSIMEGLFSRWRRSGEEGGGDEVVDGKGGWETTNEEKGGRGVGKRQGGRG